MASFFMNLTGKKTNTCPQKTPRKVRRARMGKLESLAKERTRKFMELYMKAHNKRKADQIYRKLALGKISYEQAIRELRKLAQG